ncbi:Frizzled 1 [Fasciola hepatica]|uniref:Frizzled 1 n=1 Tax=Fasciola hepatica TaxID=6192 RepID=A0A4E0S0H8_FASHE|nr:Frizzled 1 [Fasciola hepatica]
MFAFITCILCAALLRADCYIQRGLEDPYAETPKCEAIRVKACQDLPYNITIFPNDMGQSTQEEALQEINQFSSLIRIKCSPSLKLFLCSLYFPVCTVMKNPLPPCRSLCEQNRKDCEPLMRGFNFQWPAMMDCARFPEDSLCISENKTEKQPPSEPSFTCPVHMRVPPSFEFRIRMGSGQIIPDCGIPCNDFLFSDSSSRRFSRLWIGLWSCLCAASTLFTVLTFLIDMPRFQYPERPIIFLSFCYLMVALTYVAGFILNDKASS